MDDRYVHALHRLNELPSNHPRRPWFDTQGYPPLRVECSLAFYNDEHRRLLDSAAPSVESRMEALRFLRKEGFPVFLRIDPLFPRDPLDGGKTMADFGLPDVQPMRDLEGLVSFSREVERCQFPRCNPHCTRLASSRGCTATRPGWSGLQFTLRRSRSK